MLLRSPVLANCARMRARRLETSLLRRSSLRREAAPGPRPRPRPATARSLFHAFFRRFYARTSLARLRASSSLALRRGATWRKMLPLVAAVMEVASRVLPEGHQSSRIVADDALGGARRPRGPSRAAKRRWTPRCWRWWCRPRAWTAWRRRGARMGRVRSRSRAAPSFASPDRGAARSVDPLGTFAGRPNAARSARRCDILEVARAASTTSRRTRWPRKEAGGRRARGVGRFHDALFRGSPTWDPARDESARTTPARANERNARNAPDGHSRASRRARASWRREAVVVSVLVLRHWRGRPAPVGRMFRRRGRQRRLLPSPEGERRARARLVRDDGFFRAILERRSRRRRLAFRSSTRTRAPRIVWRRLRRNGQPTGRTWRARGRAAPPGSKARARRQRVRGAAPSKTMRPSAPGSDRANKVGERAGDGASARRRGEARMREAPSKLRAKAAATAASRDARERVSDPELAAAGRARGRPPSRSLPRLMSTFAAPADQHRANHDPHWHAPPAVRQPCQRDRPARRVRTTDDTRAPTVGFRAAPPPRATSPRRADAASSDSTARAATSAPRGHCEDTPIFLCATDLGIEREEGYRLAVDVEVYRPTNVYPKITGAEIPVGRSRGVRRTIPRAGGGGTVGFETRARVASSRATNPTREPSWLRDFDGLRSKRLRALLAEATVDANGRPMPVALSEREDALALADESASTARARSPVVASARAGAFRSSPSPSRAARKRTKP